MERIQLRITTHVNKTTTRNNRSIDILFSEDAKQNLNEKIQQGLNIVTCYPSLDEYKFDVTGTKYLQVDVASFVGKVERYDFETSEIVMLLDASRIGEKVVVGFNEDTTEGQILEKITSFKLVVRGLCHIEVNDATNDMICMMDRFVCFDMIPIKRKEEET